MGRKNRYGYPHQYREYPHFRHQCYRQLAGLAFILDPNLTGLINYEVKHTLLTPVEFYFFISPIIQSSMTAPIVAVINETNSTHYPLKPRSIPNAQPPINPLMTPTTMLREDSVTGTFHEISGKPARNSVPN